MARAIIDQRPPELTLHVIAGRAVALVIPVTDGVLTSPVMTMRTGAGDPYTTDPGIGLAAMSSATDLRLSWSAADTLALNDSTRGPRAFRIDIAGVVDGGDLVSVIGGVLSVYPPTYARSVPQNSATLSLNNGATLTLTITVPPSDGPWDGGAPDEVFPDGIDGGLHSDSFTDTTYDGGSI